MDFIKKFHEFYKMAKNIQIQITSQITNKIKRIQFPFNAKSTQN